MRAEDGMSELRVRGDMEVGVNGLVTGPTHVQVPCPPPERDLGRVGGESLHGGEGHGNPPRTHPKSVVVLGRVRE